MEKFECVKQLVLERFDEDGSSIENEYTTVKVGTRWEKNDGIEYNFIAGNDAVHLDEITNSNHCYWIEINEDTLEEHFIKSA